MDLKNRVTNALSPYADRAEPPGLAWCVARGDEVASGALGTYGPADGTPVGVDTAFRLSSVTKPVVAAAALSLLDDGTLTLDAPVERWLPELADRRVLRDPAGPLDDTVPATRPITVADVLELRLGIGLDFTGPFPGPVLSALAALGLHAGPPAPGANPDPDTWMRALGSVPLSYQPGERWLYHTGSEVLGVLIARAAGAPLQEVLTARVLAPLSMTSTGFGVSPEHAGRLGPHWLPSQGEPLDAYDPADGQWSRPPAFPNGGDGLVSTVADLAAFGRMLRAGGVTDDGTRVLSPEVLAEATRPRVGQIDADGLSDWGLGFGVNTGDHPDGRRAGSYGWDGGMGSTLWVDPVSDVVAVLLTNQMWSSPEPTPVFEAFWRAAWE